MNIVGEKVVLRAIEQDDIVALHRWSNDPYIQRNLGGWHFPLSKTSLQKWVDGFAHDSLDQRFVIEVPDMGTVGLVTLTGINWKDRNATHGVLIGDASRRKHGYGTDAVLAVMRYAFEELGLQRLDTTIVEYNKPSLATHIDKCGWVEEGRKASAVFRANQYWALVILGITRERHAEFRERRDAGATKAPEGAS